MPESPASRVLAATIEEWVSDPSSDVEYSEFFEGRWAVRMAQQTRDYTTVWFSAGERTVRYEAYVLPGPPDNLAEVYRQVLFRNQTAWRVHFSVDHEGGLFLTGRTACEHVTPVELDYVLAEIYSAVEVSFRPLVRAGFGR